MDDSEIPDFTHSIYPNLPKVTQENDLDDSLVLQRLRKLKALRNFAFSEHLARIRTESESSVSNGLRIRKEPENSENGLQNGILIKSNTETDEK